MINYSERDGAITFSVRVVPRASRSDIVGEHDGVLRIRIAAPPVEGAANEELIKTLARALKVPRRSIEIASGHNSRNKTVRIKGVEQRMVRQLLIQLAE